MYKGLALKQLKSRPNFGFISKIIYIFSGVSDFVVSYMCKPCPLCTVESMLQGELFTTWIINGRIFGLNIISNANHVNKNLDFVCVKL